MAFQKFLAENKGYLLTLVEMAVTDLRSKTLRQQKRSLEPIAVWANGNQELTSSEVTLAIHAEMANKEFNSMQSALNTAHALANGYTVIS